MCWVMPPFSCAATSMPMIRSNSDVLPWSTWPRKVTIGGRGCSLAGSSSCSSDLEQLARSRSTARWKLTSTPNSAASNSAVSGSERGGDVAHGAQFEQFARIVRAGTPMASEKLRTVQGRSTTTFLLPRGGRVGAGAADVRAAAAGLRRSDRRLPLRPAAPPDGGGPLAFQLPLFAAAQRGRPRLFLFRRPAGRGRARRRAPLAAGSGGSARRGGSFPSGGRLAAGDVLAPRPPAVSARACGMLGQRLRARPAGADGVGRELRVGLLRGRLRCLRRARRLRRRGQGGQFDRRSAVFFSRSLVSSLLLRAAFRARPGRGIPAFTVGSAAARRLRGSVGVLEAARRRRDLASPGGGDAALRGFFFGAAVSRAWPAGRDLAAAPCRPERCSLRAGRRPACGTDRRAGRGRGRRAGRPCPLVMKALTVRRLFVGQAGQRRAFPRDTCLRADVDQHLAVELQLFR